MVVADWVHIKQIYTGRERKKRDETIVGGKLLTDKLI